MAKDNIKILDVGGHNVVPTLKYPTEAGSTAILAGEPVKIGGTGAAFAVPVANDEPIVGTTLGMLGIAASDSNHTASLNGFVEVHVLLEGVVYEAKASTAANVDTQAEINALMHNLVGFDLASGVYTLDENDGVGTGLIIVGGDPIAKTIKFMVRNAAKHFA